jgi:hypothetical protein
MRIVNWMKNNFEAIQQECSFIEVEENFTRNGFVVIRLMPRLYVENYLKDYPEE